jgi:hypothetical protein
MDTAVRKRRESFRSCELCEKTSNVDLRYRAAVIDSCAKGLVESGRVL